MRRVFLLAGLACCGSTTTSTSTGGSFVTDVHLEGTELVSTSCIVDDIVTRETSGGRVVAAAVVSILLGGPVGSTEKKTEQVTATDCKTFHSTLPEIGAPAVNDCQAAFERWQMLANASEDQRAQVWSTLPAACRGRLEAGAR